MISDTHVNKMLIIVAYLVIAAVVSAQQDFCREGTYGHDCELTCSSNCRPLQSFPCDKATGKCSEGCKKGYYGSTCNLPCTCDSGVCIQESGGCIDDSTKINTSDKPVTDVSPHKCETSCDGVLVALIVLAILFLIVIIVFIVLFVFMRYRKKQQKTDKSGQQGRLELFLTCLKCRRDTPASTKGKETAESKTIEMEEQTTEMSNVKQPLLTEGQNVAGSSQLPEMDDKENGNTSENTTATLQQEIKNLKKQLQGTKDKLRQEYEEKAFSIQNDLLTNMGLPADSVYHGEVIGSNHMQQCPQLKYNNSLVNVQVTHIDSHGIMHNRPKDPPATGGHEEFGNYHGTSSKCSITRTGFDQYWEVSLDFTLKKPLGLKEVLLDLGFCSKEYRDVSTFTPTRENCYSLKLVGGTKNKICVFDGSKEQDNVLSVENLKDVNQSISIGILVNKKLSKIRYFELTKRKLIKTFDVKSTNELWPMFGLGAQLSATGSLKLISGFDIKMTPEKESMINDAKNKKSKTTSQKTT